MIAMGKLIRHNWVNLYCTLSDDYMDPYLKKSYRSVLILSLLNPAVNNTHFQNDIKSRARLDYGYTFDDDELVILIANFIIIVNFIIVLAIKHFDLIFCLICYFTCNVT